MFMEPQTGGINILKNALNDKDREGETHVEGLVGAAHRGCGLMDPAPEADPTPCPQGPIWGLPEIPHACE